MNHVAPRPKHRAKPSFFSSLRPQLCVVAAAAAIGCAGSPVQNPNWEVLWPFGGDGPPAPDENSTALNLGRWHKDTIHCGDGNCADWFEVEVPAKGNLRVDVYAPVGQGLPELNVVLENQDRLQLGTAPPVGRSPQRVDAVVAGGRYRVLVHGTGKNDGLLSYEIVAKIENASRVQTPKPRPTPKPTTRTKAPALTPQPAPKPAVADASHEMVSVFVLEVERDAGQPVAVLIDAGTPMGVVSGLQGELVENGESIGRIEVVDVYDAGSRARIIGPLKAPITIDTEAELRVPITD